jgi:Spy/CpxP family protein refolding chaperone
MLKKILLAAFLTSAVAFAPIAAWAQAETPEAAPSEMAPAKTHYHHHHHRHYKG